MQLTWARRKPAEPKANLTMSHGDDPFYIEPLSLQASYHTQNGSSQSLYHSYRKLAFVTEKYPDLKPRSASPSYVRKRKKPTSPCEIQAQSPSRRRGISGESSNHGSSLKGPSPMAAATGFYGEPRYAL